MYLIFANPIFHTVHLYNIGIGYYTLYFNNNIFWLISTCLDTLATDV